MRLRAGAGTATIGRRRSRPGRRRRPRSRRPSAARPEPSGTKAPLRRVEGEEQAHRQEHHHPVRQERAAARRRRRKSHSAADEEQDEHAAGHGRRPAGQLAPAPRACYPGWSDSPVEVRAQRHLVPDRELLVVAVIHSVWPPAEGSTAPKTARLRASHGAITARQARAEARPIPSASAGRTSAHPHDHATPARRRG